MDADKPVMKEIVRYFEQEPEGDPLDVRGTNFLVRWVICL